MRKKRSFKNRHPEKISGTVTVRAEDFGDNTDKMVRRFIKKVKNEGIVEEFRSRTHYVKPSDRRREEKRQRKRLIQKVNKQRQDLLKPRDRFLKRR